MKSNITKVAIAALLGVMVIGCSEKEPEPKSKEYVPTFECKQENVLAPRWTCIPEVQGFYAGVGIANKSAAGASHMRKVAMMNGRSDLAQQIATDVKDKMQGFTQTTGNAQNETVDAVTKAVTNQAAHVNLQNSKAVDMWNAPSGAIYMLVTVPEDIVNNELKSAVKTSFNNDDARWQQFQASKAFEELNKELPSN